MSVQSSSEEPLFRMICIADMDFTTLFDYQYFNKLQQFFIKYHKQNNLSSLNCFSDGIFLSYVEGSEQDLTDLKNIILSQKKLQHFHWVDFQKITERTLNNRTFKLFFPAIHFYHNPFKEFLPFTPKQWSLQKNLALVACMKKQDFSYSTQLTSKKHILYLQLHWFVRGFFNHNFREHLLVIVCFLLLACLLVTLTILALVT